MTRRKRDESGAVAIIVSLLAVLMLSMAALTVDLGQAWVTSHDVQKSADFSALAGGVEGDLPTTTTGGTCLGGAGYLDGPAADPASPAVNDVAEYLNTNPFDFGTDASKLTNCQMSDGEVIFGEASKQADGSWKETYDATELTVVSPPQKVDFGFARIFGAQDTDIQRVATVGLFTPLLQRTLPYYAAQGCDYGNQTIAQPSNGLAANAVNLDSGSQTNNAAETALVTNPASNPPTVAYPLATPTSLEIDGSGFTGATKVGFFESGSTSAGPPPTEFALTPDMVTDTKILIPDFSSTKLAQDTWYVRIFAPDSAGVAQWSAVADKKGTLNALPLTVGAPNLVCSQGGNVGNFGSLLLNNSQGPKGETDNIAYNVATGLEHPLDYFPNPQSPWTCPLSAGDGTVLWPNDNTNCVDTKTGDVAADSAYEGLLIGVPNPNPTVPGLLTHVGANTGCAPDGTPATTVFRGITINNDTLSCFFDTSAVGDVTVGDVDAQNYTLSAPAFTTAIFTSPRFVYVPVLGTTPSGGSDKYQIIDFRPAFITDQLNSAYKNTPEATCTSSSCNGLTMTSNGKSLLSLQVIMINQAALPQCPITICQDVKKYTGKGTQQLRLIN
ncbi:MAG TPA: Tad domain-containing protein [Nocardioides sp.]|uniref:TadE/TadG family type IV pilus assembly protein n=1 Tax=Nocardioides sp. TaxID=35761 RepID=UPI002F428E09